MKKEKDRILKLKKLIRTPVPKPTRVFKDKKKESRKTFCRKSENNE